MGDFLWFFFVWQQSPWQWWQRAQDTRRRVSAALVRWGEREPCVFGPPWKVTRFACYLYATVCHLSGGVTDRQTDAERQRPRETEHAAIFMTISLCLSLSPKSVKNNNKTLCWTWPCTNSSCYMSPTTSMNLMNPQVTLNAEKVTEPATKPPYKLRAHRGPFNQFFRE